jgi:hypothetical protein
MPGGFILITGIDGSRWAVRQQIIGSSLSLPAALDHRPWAAMVAAVPCGRSPFSEKFTYNQQMLRYSLLILPNR